MKKLLPLIGVLTLTFFVTSMALAQAGAQAEVAVALLNARQAPGTGYPVVAEYPYNAVVTINGREVEEGNGGIWVYVTPAQGGTSGWVLSAFLRLPSNFSYNSVPITWPDGSAAPAPAANSAPAGDTGSSGGMPAVTASTLNMRSGPGTSYNVVATLPYKTSVTLTSRSQDSVWVFANANGQTGWLHSGYLTLGGNKTTLPVAGADTASAASAPTTSAAPPPPSGDAGALGNLVSGVNGYTREIYLRGQTYGRQRDVFSKVGDSITSSDRFLGPVGRGGAQLGAYGYLQSVIEFYTTTPARTGNSFANVSLAANSGWLTYDLLDPSKAPAMCNGMIPLQCEYEMNRPAVAIIMIGSNDLNWGIGTDAYRNNLNTIVGFTVDMGIIPILSTLPANNLPGGEQQNAYNAVIVDVAHSFNIPLVDYAAASRDLPNHGLSSDGIHPSSGGWNTAIFSSADLKYGFNMRNLTALIALDAVWRQAMY